MHRMLNIAEILFHIFHCCCPRDPGGDCRKCGPQLAILARMCRVFKEPALNILWSSLADLAPIVRCLPDASHQLPQRNTYAFTRQITLMEWSILQSYTRRIRYISYFNQGLDRKSIQVLLSPPITESLFPNLHSLGYGYMRKCTPLLQIPFPSLQLLNVEFSNPKLFQEAQVLQLFSKFSPNIERLSIHVRHQTETTSINPIYLSHWRNLRSLVCPELALDANAFLHLSRMPTLTQLVCTVGVMPTFDRLYLIPNLGSLGLHSKSLDPIGRLLHQVQLPAITDFTACISECPSKQELSAFFAGIYTSDAGYGIQSLWLKQSSPSSNDMLRSEAPLLGFEDLRPCMAFHNLCLVDLNIGWNVGLTDSELLALVSAWRKLRYLWINEDWGWNSQGGITPDGLVRLLQACRLLNDIALTLDTRGYEELHTSQTLQSIRLALPPTLFINVLDSVIEEESVPAIASVFSGITACSDFSLVAWKCQEMVEHLNMEEYMQRWDDIDGRVNSS